MAGAAVLTVGVPLTRTRWATTVPWPLPSALNSAGAYFANVMGKAADVPIVTLEEPVAALYGMATLHLVAVTSNTCAACAPTKAPAVALVGRFVPKAAAAEPGARLAV